MRGRDLLRLVQKMPITCHKTSSLDPMVREWSLVFDQGLYHLRYEENEGRKQRIIEVVSEDGEAVITWMAQSNILQMQYPDITEVDGDPANVTVSEWEFSD